MKCYKVSKMRSVNSPLAMLGAGLVGDLGLDCSLQCIGTGDYQGCMNTCRASKSTKNVNVIGQGGQSGQSSNNDKILGMPPMVAAAVGLGFGGLLVYALTR